jgi:hypothetical protein
MTASQVSADRVPNRVPDGGAVPPPPPTVSRDCVQLCPRHVPAVQSRSDPGREAEGER